MFCTNCGSNVPEGSRFCTECGADVTAAAAPAQETAAASKQEIPNTTVDTPIQQSVPPTYSAPVQQAYTPPQQAYSAPTQQTYAPVTPAYSTPNQNNYNATPQYTYQYQQPQNNNDAVLSTGQFFLTFLVFAIPLVGFIMMLVWGFGSNVNRNRKNLCRAALIWMLIGIGLGIIIGIISAIFVSTVGENLFDNFGYYFY